MSAQINQWIDMLFEITGFSGYEILILTLPLGIIQGIFGLFPFATLVLLQVSMLGVRDGLAASWFVGTVSAIVVYYLCRSTFADWFHRKWLHRLQKYEKWERYLEQFGGWGIIFLRTIPVMPNNLISFVAAVTKMKPGTYTWSNIVGNLSHIWLFGIISASIVFPDTDIWLLTSSYILFCLLLIGMFIYGQRRKKREVRKKMI